MAASGLSRQNCRLCSLESKVLHPGVTRKSLFYAEKKREVMNISVSGKKMRRKMVERKGLCRHCQKRGSAAAEGSCMDVCPLVLQASDSTEASV